MKNTAVVGALLTLWAGALLAGFAFLMDYSHAAGPAADAGPHWPDSAGITPSEGQGALVLFAHPRCPCTRATLGEFERLLRHVRGDVEAHVVFLRPEGRGQAWVEASDLWQRAAGWPYAQVHVDPSGQEARRFGAYTSGQVLYYDAEGRLRFDGGITASRGHEGQNKGRQALHQLITTGAASTHSTPVFGCALYSSASSSASSWD